MSRSRLRIQSAAGGRAIHAAALRGRNPKLLSRKRHHTFADTDIAGAQLGTAPRIGAAPELMRASRWFRFLSGLGAPDGNDESGSDDFGALPRHTHHTPFCRAWPPGIASGGSIIAPATHGRRHPGRRRFAKALDLDVWVRVDDLSQCLVLLPKRIASASLHDWRV